MSMFRLGMVALAVGLLAPGPADAFKPDMSPRPTAVLPKAGQFIAQCGPNTVALFALKDGTLIREFRASGRIWRLDVSADETLLAIAAEGLTVWEIATGKKLWQRSGSDGYDVSFAWNGKTLIAGYTTTVHDAWTGRVVAGLPNMDSSVLSAALAPDGSSALISPLEGTLHIWDVKNGILKNTGLESWRPVRYSATGQWAACRMADRIFLVKMGDPPTAHAVQWQLPETGAVVGGFENIRPQADGSFLITSWLSASKDGGLCGWRCDPETQKAEMLWRISRVEDPDPTMDFDPASMMGVWTSYTYVTRGVDLRTGKIRFTLDYSANYQMHDPRFRGWAWVVLGCVAVLGVCAVLAFWYWRALSTK